SRDRLGVLPSPLWGGVGGGGPSVREESCVTASPPSPRLPHKGGGSRPNARQERRSTSIMLAQRDRSWRPRGGDPRCESGMRQPPPAAATPAARDKTAPA